MDEPELFMGDLRGYRAWTPRYDKDGKPVLIPLFQGTNTPWGLGVQEARCETQPSLLRTMLSITGEFPVSVKHDAPAPDCMCGFWGFYGDGDKRYQLDTQLYAPYRVTGVIRSGGIVEMHETGFRAQKAELVALAPARSANTDGTEDSFSFRCHGGEAFAACRCRGCEALRNPNSMMYLLISGMLPRDFRLAIGEDCVPSLAELGDVYGVPTFGSWAEMLKAFPPTHQDEVKPPIEWTDEGWVSPSVVSNWLSGYMSSKYQVWSRPSYSFGGVVPTWTPLPAGLPAAPVYSFDTDELKESAAIPATDVVKALQAEDCKNKNTESKEQPTWPTSANPSAVSKSSPSLTPQPPQSVNRLRPLRRLNPFGNRSRRSK